MTIKELLVKLRVQADAKALDDVRKRLDWLSLAFKAFIAIKVIGFFENLAKKFGETGQHITVLAAAAGLGVEQYQKLAYAAQQNGIKHEKFSVGLTRMNHQMERAKNGAVTAIGVFTRAGIQPEQIKSWHNSSDALYALQDAFAKMKGPDAQARKLAVVTELFGRGAHNFLLLMDQGSGAVKKMEADAVRAGAVISAHNVQELNKTKMAWSSLWETFKAQGATIFAAFSPIFRAVAFGLQEAIGSGAGAIDKTAKGWANQFGGAIGTITGKVIRFGKWFARHSEGISDAFFNVINFIVAAINTFLESPLIKEVGSGFSDMWDAISGKNFDGDKFRKGFWTAVVGMIAAVGTAILQLLMFVAKRVGSVIEALWQQFKDFYKANWPEAYEFIASAFEKVQKLVGGFKATVQDFFDSVKRWIEETYRSVLTKYNAVADNLPVLGLKHIDYEGEGPATDAVAKKDALRRADYEPMVEAQGAGSSWIVDLLRSFAPQLVAKMQTAQMPLQSPAPGPQSSVMAETKENQSKVGSYYNIVVPINIQQPVGSDERKIADLATDAIKRFFRDELKDAHQQVAPRAAT